MESAIKPERKHWTEVHTYECKIMGATMTARQIFDHERYGAFLRKARFNLINCTLGDTVRMDDGTKWTRIR